MQLRHRHQQRHDAPLRIFNWANEAMTVPRPTRPTIFAISYGRGATPVFVDVEPVDRNIHTAQIEAENDAAMTAIPAR